MPVQTRSHLYWYSFVCRSPMNPSDFFLQSVLPLERMFREGVFDKSIQFVPVLDGLQQPRYFQWWLSPFTRHEVTSALYEGVRTLCTTHTQLVQPLPTWRGHSLSPLHMYARVLAGRAAQYSEMRFAGGAPGRGLSEDQRGAALLPARGAVQPVALLALASGAQLAGRPPPQFCRPTGQPALDPVLHLTVNNQGTLELREELLPAALQHLCAADSRLITYSSCQAFREYMAGGLVFLQYDGCTH